MKSIGRIGALFAAALMVTSVVSAIAALVTKRRIVPLDAADADEIRVRAIFEPLTFRSTATSFRGGSIDCWYGGGVVDLRQATLDPAGAVLRVRAIFGGGQILVPETWFVDLSVRGIGGASDVRPKVERTADAPRLTIEGLVLFGGFAVMSEMAGQEEVPAIA
jgi:predicted membrane protein